MKLSNRLSLVVTAVSAVVLLACFSFAYLLVSIEERRELDTILQVQAHSLVDRIQSLDGAKGPEALARAAEGARGHPHIVALYDETGAVIWSTHNLEFAWKVPSFEHLGILRSKSPEGQTFALQVSERSLRAIEIPLAGDRETLVYALSRHSEEEDMDYLRRTLGVLFLLGTLSTWLFSRWLGGRLTRDVRAIGGVARQVAKGDFAARVAGSARGSDETRALGAHLDFMIEQLGQLMVAQRVFVSHAAHELRSPLASLRGELQLALRRPRHVEEYQETLVRVLSDVESLVQLAEDLLSLARAQAPSTLSQTVTVRAVLASALRASKGLSDLKQVSVELDPLSEQAGDALVRGSALDVGRALRNLIDNSVQHSESGARVLITAKTVGTQVTIAVEDTGRGVDKRDQAAIFEPFFRATAEQGQESGGAGLGLPIARKIAQTVGGEVELDPSYTRGARFVLSLPIVSDE